MIPTTLAPEQKTKPEDFTRTRKLPFPKLMASILSLVADGTRNGVDIHAGKFFRDARRSGLWPNAEAIHRSALTKARKKVPWDVFQNMLNDAVQLAYELWPDAPFFTWHGMSVFAIDGSKYTLPATPALRQEFDPHSGLGNPGKGHYPQCLVSTLYDVFRRLPIARTIKSIHASERDEVAHLLPFVPETSILLCDRGYPSYDLFRLLSRTFNGYFLFRSPASSTFPAVEEFVASGTQEAIIWITPTNSVLKNATPRQRKLLKALKLRVILLKSPDGTVSVLITNLLNRVSFPREEIIALYFDRWEVEEYYKDEKVTLDIERFHARTGNGIRQELFAAMIMTVISRTMMMLAAQQFLADGQECQFKNAIITLASEAALLVPHDPEQAVFIFHEVLQEMARVKYYRPKTPRPSQPRINKHPPNKWSTRNRQTAT
ncbi:MAG: IS4 family transposase [Proteobacteria bacterium]|nr:IS4 family transposase [Pseudomonadota bacterium]